MSTNRKISRAAKVKALVKRPGTVGEGAAAKAALERLSVTVASPAAGAAHLTDAIVRRLAPPASGNRIYWDTVAGFGCRVTAAGAKSYVFNYRVKGSGQQRRITIGAVGSWFTSAARIKAKELRRIVDDGGDPRGDDEEDREAPTMWDLCDRFEEEYLPRKRPATIDSYSRLIRIHIKPHFGQFKKVSDVTYSDVDGLHRAVTKKGSVYAANRCVAVLSKMFSLAIKWEMRTTNPAKGIERNSEAKRKRYLSEDELKRLTGALAETSDRQFATIVTILMLTGARRGEVLSMRFDNLDLAKGIWSKPGSTTKQATDHIVPLSAAVVLLLKEIKRDGDFVFPSDSKTGHVQEIKKSWATLCKAAGITGLRLHDLRHSYASQLVSTGASLALIGALLGHSNPTTTHRYAHLFDDPQREASEKVAAIFGNASGDRHD